MALRRRHLIALLLGLALTLSFAIVPGVAQTSAPAGGPTLRYTVFALHPIADLACAAPNATNAATSTAKPTPLQFQPFSRSPRYTYAGPAPLRFVDTKTGQTVAEAAVPATLHDALLLFSELPPGNPRGLRYQVAILDDSLTQLPRGRLVILNLSGLKLTGTLDTAALAIADGLNPPVPLAKPAKLTLRTLVHGTAVQAFAAPLQPSKAARILLILFPPARPGAVELQTRALVDDPPKSSARL